MANQENGEASIDQTSNAMVETSPAGPRGSGAGAMAMSNPFGAMGASTETDVLKGGLDRSWLYNSLRRRWLLALSMSLFIGTVAAGLLFVLFPESFSAIAQYKVASDPLTVLDRASSNQTDDFEIFKNTQIAYIRSPFVLTAALRDNRVSSLEMFDDVEDKVEWLKENLQVAFPNDGEILTIAMSGAYPEEDLKLVVDAVSKSYYSEVVSLERNTRAKPLQVLKQSFAKLDTQIRNKMLRYQELAKESGSSEIYKGFDPQTKVMLVEVENLQKQQSQLRTQLSQTAIQFRVFEQQINDPAYQERLVDEQLQADPNIAQMQSEMMSIDFQIRSLQSTVKNGTSSAIRRLVRQREGLSQQIAQTREQMKAMISGQQSNEPNPLLKAQSTAYQIESAMLNQEIDKMQQRVDELQEELLIKAENNTDLEIRTAEIEQLRLVQQGMATKIQNLQVELGAPERIQAIGQDSSGSATAETFTNRNRLTRIAISGAGGIGLFLLTGFGIGYMEFTNRKLNGPGQVDEGLGIRVVGTLPSLSGRKALNPNHPVVAQLNESIDSVRTALMHESTSKRRQLVMVTSAATMEGRTTVASQLAASLARAGRRTLLVDGDLRRPALHALFNSPLEDGLSEVLRAEAEPADVIRPTQAEGLWLMTAGYCDADAVKALATDQMQPIFEKLRADYDFIIIDGPPVLGLSDSLLFGQYCDGAILSVLRDESCVTKIHQAAELLRSVRVRLIGSVVNGVTTKADQRVTHLQQVTPKSQQKQLETSDA